MPSMDSEYHIMVCGSREMTDEMQAKLGEIVKEILQTAKKHRVIVHHGGAEGADLAFGKALRYTGVMVLEHKADWKKFGKAAGSIRTRKTFDSYPIKAVYALVNYDAHGQSKGTRNTIQMARSKKYKIDRDKIHVFNFGENKPVEKPKPEQLELPFFYETRKITGYE